MIFSCQRYPPGTSDYSIITNNLQNTCLVPELMKFYMLYPPLGALSSWKFPKMLLNSRQLELSLSFASHSSMKFSRLSLHSITIHLNSSPRQIIHRFGTSDLTAFLLRVSTCLLSAIKTFLNPNSNFLYCVLLY